MSAPRAHLHPGRDWLRRLMKRLRTHAPLSVPVRVVRRVGARLNNGEWVLGYAMHRRATKTKKMIRYRIVVDARLSPGEAWEVVLHEYAHCLDRDTRVKSPKDCHDSRWGQCFARAFRASLNRSKPRRSARARGKGRK